VSIAKPFHRPVALCIALVQNLPGRFRFSRLVPVLAGSRQVEEALREVRLNITLVALPHDLKTNPLGLACRMRWPPRI